MEKQITRNWYMVLIKGIIMILLAILVFNHPGATLLGVAVYLGIGLVITGIIAIGLGIAERKLSPNWGWRTFEGVIDLILGLIVINNPILTVSIIPFLIGFWAAIYGIFLFIDAFSSKDSRGLKMISGILIFLLAWVLMFNPLFMGLTMVIWFGVLLLINGIANVIISFGLRKIK
jgi:uncharacterized membrane protein HdeD (DUF308 family)